MNSESIHWDLEFFLKSRSFQELNADQQNWVLQQMSQSEYESQRWTLLASADFFRADAIPAPPPLEQILQRHQERNPRQSSFSWLAQLSTWRVPAWQLSMALICGWLFGQWNVGNHNSTLSLVPQIVYQTDTIVREIPIYIGLGKQQAAEYKQQQEQQRQGATTPPNSSRTRNSNSIARDKDLLDFAVGMQ